MQHPMLTVWNRDRATSLQAKLLTDSSGFCSSLLILFLDRRLGGEMKGNANNSSPYFRPPVDFAAAARCVFSFPTQLLSMKLMKSLKDSQCIYQNQKSAVNVLFR